MAKKKWRKVDVIAVAAVAGVFLLALVVLLVQSARFYAEEGATYTVDLSTTWRNASWTTTFDPALADVLQSGRDAGVPCALPEDAVFRGVIISGRDVEGRVLQYRVMPDMYYIEYRDGAVRCVDDARPWVPISKMLRSHLSPRVQEYLVKQGVL